MKPIRSVMGGAIVTLILLVSLAFGASLVPQSMATEPMDDQPIAEQASPTSATGLIVEIHDVRSGNGELLVVVFDSQSAYNNYDYSAAAGLEEVAADSRLVLVSFESLREGPYAVFIFHDENDDDDLNMNGDYPLEGYGTSGARNWWHEPSFAEAASDAGKIRVKMYYPD